MTGKMYGAVTLIDDFPDIYNKLFNQYKETMDMALEKQMFNVTHDITGKLTAIVEILGFYRFSPRDVVDIHTKALKENVSASETTEKKRAYKAEGWLLVVETMGLLASYYRNRATSGDVT
jgi:hypothetical protein